MHSRPTLSLVQMSSLSIVRLPLALFTLPPTPAQRRVTNVTVAVSAQSVVLASNATIADAHANTHIAPDMRRGHPAPIGSAPCGILVLALPRLQRRHGIRLLHHIHHIMLFLLPNPLQPRLILSKLIEVFTNLDFR